MRCFSPINLNVGLTQLNIDHRKAFDQVPKPPELGQLLLGCFDPIMRNVVSDRFFDFHLYGSTASPDVQVYRDGHSGNWVCSICDERWTSCRGEVRRVAIRDL